MIVVASFAGLLQAVRHGRTQGVPWLQGRMRFASRYLQGLLPVGWSLLIWLGLTELSCRILEAVANGVSAQLAHVPVLYLLARVPFHLVSFAIYFTGAAATWNSLGRRRQSRWNPWVRHAGRAAIALVTAVLLFQVGFDHVRFATLRSPGALLAGLRADRPTHFTQSPDRRRLAMSGPITFASAEELRRRLEDDPEIRAIDLSSPGGKVASSFAMADEVKVRRLDTHVLDRCTSACTVILLAGTERTAPTDARIGFHTSTSATYGYTDAALRAYFLQHGLSKAFVDRALTTPSDSMWYPSSRMLLDEGVLTEVTDESADDD